MAAIELYDTPLLADANLQAYYRFENNLTDSSANGYNLTDGGSSDTASGKFNHGRVFVSASKNYVTYANPTNLLATGNKTITYWIYYNDVTALAATAWGIYGGTGSCFDQLTATPSITFKIAGLTDNTSSVTLSNSTWYFVAERLSGTSKAIFVNGTKDEITASGTETSKTSSSYLSIGRPGNYDGQYLSAIIDDWAYFDRALTDTEVAGLYAGTMVTTTTNYLKKFRRLSFDTTEQTNYLSDYRGRGRG